MSFSSYENFHYIGHGSQSVEKEPQEMTPQEQLIHNLGSGILFAGGGGKLMTLVEAKIRNIQNAAGNGTFYRDQAVHVHYNSTPPGIHNYMPYDRFVRSVQHDVTRPIDPETATKMFITRNGKPLDVVFLSLAGGIHDEELARRIILDGNQAVVNALMNQLNQCDTPLLVFHSDSAPYRLKDGFEAAIDLYVPGARKTKILDQLNKYADRIGQYKHQLVEKLNARQDLVVVNLVMPEVFGTEMADYLNSVFRVCGVDLGSEEAYLFTQGVGGGIATIEQTAQWTVDAMSQPFGPKGELIMPGMDYQQYQNLDWSSIRKKNNR